MQNNAYKKQLIWNFNTNELLDIFLKDRRISMQLWEIKKKRSLEGTGSSYDQKFVC